MKNLLIKIGAAMLSGLLLYGVSLVVTGDKYWCFKDHDTCAVEEMEYWRDVRDNALKEENERHKTTEATILAYYNDGKIKPIKPTISTGKALEELQKGNKENVPEGFFALRNAFIPQANASSGELLTDTDISIQVPPAYSPEENTTTVRFGSTIPVGRYGKVLAEIGSPYASLPIEQYCNKAGIPEKGCDLLLGIAHAESKSGTDFKCNYKTWDEAVKLGQTVYFNPVGRFVGNYWNGRKVPDSNGCYLQQFKSWEDFWDFYTDRMANNIYNFKERTEVYTMRRLYVFGDTRPWDSLSQWEKNEALNSPWVQANNWFVNKVKEANS